MSKESDVLLEIKSSHEQDFIEAYGYDEQQFLIIHGEQYDLLEEALTIGEVDYNQTTFMELISNGHLSKTNYTEKVIRDVFKENCVYRSWIDTVVEDFENIHRDDREQMLEEVYKFVKELTDKEKYNY